MVERNIQNKMCASANSLAAEKKVGDWIGDSKDLCIFFLGKVGCGKSALINSVLKKDVAEESSGLFDHKDEDELHYKGPLKCLEKLTRIRGIRVVLWESRGLQNPSQPKKTAAELLKASEEAARAHLFVYCISIKSRPTNADFDSLQSITQVLGTAFWKRTVFALTFSNDLSLPPDGKFNSIEKYSKHRLNEWHAYLHESTLCHGSGLIPIIPTGYRDESLFGDINWSVKFWHACITRINCLALPAFLAVNPNKMQPDVLARCITAVDFGSEKTVSKFSTLSSKNIVSQLFKQMKDMVADVVEEKITRTLSDEHISPTTIELNLSNLRLLKMTDRGGRHHEVRILEGVMNQWLEIGDLLEINDPTLSSFGEKTLRNPMECCRNVFQEWIKKGGTEKYPCTWNGVVQLLQDIQCNSLAMDMKQIKLR